MTNLNKTQKIIERYNQACDDIVGEFESFLEQSRKENAKAAAEFKTVCEEIVSEFKSNCKKLAAERKALLQKHAKESNSDALLATSCPAVVPHDDSGASFSDVMQLCSYCRDTFKTIDIVVDNDGYSCPACGQLLLDLDDDIPPAFKGS